MHTMIIEGNRIELIAESGMSLSILLLSPKISIKSIDFSPPQIFEKKLSWCSNLRAKLIDHRKCSAFLSKFTPVSTSTASRELIQVSTWSSYTSPYFSLEGINEREEMGHMITRHSTYVTNGRLFEQVSFLLILNPYGLFSIVCSKTGPIQWQWNKE